MRKMGMAPDVGAVLGLPDADAERGCDLCESRSAYGSTSLVLRQSCVIPCVTAASSSRNQLDAASFGRARQAIRRVKKAPCGAFFVPFKGLSRELGCPSRQKSICDSPAPSG